MNTGDKEYERTREICSFLEEVHGAREMILLPQQPACPGTPLGDTEVNSIRSAPPRSNPGVRAPGWAWEPRPGKGGQVVMLSAGAGGGGTMEKSLYLATGGRGPGSPARSGKLRRVC